MPKSVHTQQYRLLCELLIKARKKAGLTQAELGHRLRRPQSYVSKYENGERRLDVVEFLQVMRAMDVNFRAVARALKTVSEA